MVCVMGNICLSLPECCACFACLRFREQKMRTVLKMTRTTMATAIPMATPTPFPEP